MSHDMGHVCQKAEGGTARSVEMAETTHVMQQDTASGTTMGAAQAGRIFMIAPTAPRSLMSTRGAKKGGLPEEPAR